MGYRSLYGTTYGYNNTAVGVNSLDLNIGGYYNTAVGNGALHNILYGYNNTAIGSAAGDGDGNFITLNSINNATMIGQASQATCSNCVILGGQGNNAASIGIGTPNPTNFFSAEPVQYKTGTVAATNGSGSIVGTGTTFTSAMVGSEIYIGSNSSYAATYKGTITAYTDATHITVSPAVGYTISGAGFYVLYTGLQIASSGNVGIGTLSPTSFSLQIAGNVGPDATDTYNLGSASLEWNNLYVKNIISSATSGTNGFWQLNSGALSPANITNDLLLGATGTSSAKFGFLNVAGGTPTATISSNLSLKVPTGNAPASTINLLNNGSLGVYNSVGGDAGLGTNPALYIANSGNIGIGISNPTASLDIVPLPTNDATKVYVKVDGDANGSYVHIGALWGGDWTGLTFDAQGSEVWRLGRTGSFATNNYLYLKNANNATPAMTFADTSGNVGIDNANPTTALDIGGSASESGNLTFRGGGSQKINLLNNSTLGFYNSVGGDAGLGANPALFIASSGNVGIGSTNPTSPLYVTGGTNDMVAMVSTLNSSFIRPFEMVDGSMTSGENLVYHVGHDLSNYDSGYFGFNFQGLNSPDNFITMGFWGNDNLYNFTSAGHVVFGDTHLVNAALAVNQQASTGDIFDASQSGNTKFVISNGGNVGIGTATPHGALDVVGAAVLEGSVLTSPGTGATGNGSNVFENTLGDQGSLIPNAGFEANAVSSFADGWTIAATNAATITRDTVTQAKGNASARIVQSNGNITAIYSACIPLAGVVGSYTLNYYIKGVSSQNATIGSFLDLYDTQAHCQSDDVSMKISNAAQVATSTNAWKLFGSGTTKVGGLSNSGNWARAHFEFTCSTTTCTTNLDGVRLTETNEGSGLDYAENYPANPANIPQPGDIVSVASTSANEQIEPSNTYMDQTAIGVVSTNPGYILDDGSMADPKVPIALAGRVPVKVSSKNGAIHVGDYLTSSDIPGVAVKAMQSGPVIGKALENYTATDASKIGSILMFVNVTSALIQPQLVQFSSDGNILINGLPIVTSPDSLPATSSAGITPVTLSTVMQKIVSGNQNTVNQVTLTVSQLQSEVASQTAQLGKIDNLSKQVAELLKAQTLTQTLQGISTQAAVLGAQTTNNNATVSGSLSVLGDTLLTHLGVTGTINTGVLSINGMDELGNASINTLSGPLKLQSDGINGIDIANGKVTIDSNGNMVTSGIVTAKTVHADKYEVTDTGTTASVGQVVLPIGQTEIQVTTLALTNKSKIFVEPENVPVSTAIQKTASDSFSIKIQQAQNAAVTLDWWIVN